MKKKLALGFVMASVLLASGCASIVSDSVYPVTIKSSPAGADFTVTNEVGMDVHTGVTPDTISLAASDGFFSSATYTIRYHMTGYREHSFELKAGLDGWYIGNILLGGVIGMLIVDPATGAMWKLPESANVTLQPVTASASMGGLTIASIDQVPEDIKSQLVRVN